MQVEGHMMTLHKDVGGNFSTDNEMDESSCDVCGQETIKMRVECHDITLHKPGLKLASKALRSLPTWSEGFDVSEMPYECTS